MKQIWDKWELIAIDFLKRNWYILVDTNFKFSIFWEIDLICKKDDLTIFIEVKYRSNDFFWTAGESITKSKLKKLKKTVDYYCVNHKINFEKIRFDVITIEKQTNSHKLTHYKNQFLPN